jgi:hypothetical protein
MEQSTVSIAERIQFLLADSERTINRAREVCAILAETIQSRRRVKTLAWAGATERRVGELIERDSDGPTPATAEASGVEGNAIHSLTPICAWCKRVRTGDGVWKTEDVPLMFGGPEYTHGICPACLEGCLAELAAGQSS